MNRSFKRVAIEAALESGLFIKGSLGKVGKISYKGRINIVTDVDRRSESMIIKKIRASFPCHSILSEESAPEQKESDYRWIIDPLDGTTNFSRGFPFFAVSIALEERGRVILGAVYDPMRDELFYAEEGKGAYLNKKIIHVSGTRRLSQAFLATGFAYGIKGAGDTNVGNFEKFLMRALAVRRAGSAALDLCYVARGVFDGFWELDLQPWDSAAASLVVKESKGLVTKFDGSKYTYKDKEVLATNNLVHREMILLLSQNLANQKDS